MSLFNSVLALVTRKRSSSASTAECYVCGGNVRHLCVRCRHRAR